MGSKAGEKKKAGHWLDNWTIFIVGVVIVPAFIALAFMVGKHNLPWWEYRGKDVVNMNTGGCCTQAIVFPREKVEGLRNFLMGVGHGQTDLMIEDYAEKEGMERAALGKQVVQHVGAQSKHFDFLNGIRLQGKKKDGVDEADFCPCRFKRCRSD